MKRWYHAAALLLLVHLLIAPLTQVARAQYLDPGTGNFLFQIIVSGLMFVVFFFSRIKAWVLRVSRKEESAADGSSSPR